MFFADFEIKAFFKKNHFSEEALNIAL